MDSVVRINSIAAMDGSNPAVKRLAYLGKETSSSAEVSAARINLAIHEPRIKDRFPMIVFAASVYNISQTYVASGTGEQQEVPGESISFVLSQVGTTLAEEKWNTNFPYRVSQHDAGFMQAEVSGEKLLAKLLHNAVFTHDDLTELSSSEIPELRAAAKHRLAEIQNNPK
jgi:hypothetical protein